jgi:hypothetical protein
METEDVSQSRDGVIEILSLVPLILSLAAASQLGKAPMDDSGEIWLMKVARIHRHSARSLCWSAVIYAYPFQAFDVNELI